MTDGAHKAPAHTSEARLALAGSLRRLGNALVAHQPDDALMEDIARLVDEVTPAVEAAPERPHAFLSYRDTLFAAEMPDGVEASGSSVFPDCVISGRANPMGVAARMWRDGDEAVCQVTLGDAFEGAPGRAHGGIVAALLDETMGLIMSQSSSPAFTGRLAITYRAPTPLGQPLEARARLAGRSGRKITVTGELRCGEQLLAQGEGLFITVELDHFFATAE